MRFYRGLRSKRDPPPPEIISKVQEAENDAGGAKLHNLYQHYLACQGTWKESTLVISVSKRTRNRAAETFSFITYKYGEELALDLNQRLEEQEKKVEKKTPGKIRSEASVFRDSSHVACCIVAHAMSPVAVTHGKKLQPQHVCSMDYILVSCDC